MGVREHTYEEVKKGFLKAERDLKDVLDTLENNSVLCDMFPEVREVATTLNIVLARVEDANESFAAVIETEEHVVTDSDLFAGGEV